MSPKDSAPPDPTKALKQISVQMAELSARLKELQFSVDAVGTIVNIDLKNDLSLLPAMIEKMDILGNRIDRQSSAIVDVESSISDASAKLDIVTARADLLEKRLSDLCDQCRRIAESISADTRP